MTIENLPFQAESAVVRRYQIDSEHSNAYTAWRSLGSPQDPSPDQISIVRERQGLELVDSTEASQKAQGPTLSLSLELPLPSAALLQISPK
jgi:xylan 1,4-beta-xylosidase